MFKLNPTTVLSTIGNILPLRQRKPSLQIGKPVLFGSSRDIRTLGLMDIPGATTAGEPTLFANRAEYVDVDVDAALTEDDEGDEEGEGEEYNSGIPPHITISVNASQDPLPSFPTLDITETDTLGQGFYTSSNLAYIDPGTPGFSVLLSHSVDHPTALLNADGDFNFQDYIVTIPALGGEVIPVRTGRAMGKREWREDVPRWIRETVVDRYSMQHALYAFDVGHRYASEEGFVLLWAFIKVSVVREDEEGEVSLKEGEDDSILSEEQDNAILAGEDNNAILAEEQNDTTLAEEHFRTKRVPLTPIDNISQQPAEGRQKKIRPLGKERLRLLEKRRFAERKRTLEALLGRRKTLIANRPFWMDKYQNALHSSPAVNVDRPGTDSDSDAVPYQPAEVVTDGHGDDTEHPAADTGYHIEGSDPHSSWDTSWDTHGSSGYHADIEDEGEGQPNGDDNGGDESNYHDANDSSEPRSEEKEDPTLVQRNTLDSVSKLELFINDYERDYPKEERDFMPLERVMSR